MAMILDMLDDVHCSPNTMFVMVTLQLSLPYNQGGWETVVNNDSDCVTYRHWSWLTWWRLIAAELDTHFISYNTPRVI